MLIKAIKLLRAGPEQVWEDFNAVDNTYDVEFKDATVSMTSREIMLTLPLWELFSIHKLVPPSGAIFKMDDYGTDSAREVANVVLNYVVTVKPELNNPTDIYDMVYILTNNIDSVYEVVAGRLGAHMTSLDIMDYIEIHEHPVVAAARASITRESSKDELNLIMANVLKAIRSKGGLLNSKGEELKISSSVNNNMLKGPQVMQSILARGYVQEINLEIINYPVTANLVEGNRELEDFAFQCRDSSVSIVSNVAELGDVTHLCLKHGYVTSSILKVILNKDCGSKHTWGFKVENTDDLLAIDGRYHIEDGEIRQIQYQYVSDSGTKVLNPDYERYIGQYVMLRSPINCKLPNRQHICETCFGSTARYISPEDSVGKAFNREESRPRIQSPLSMKHTVSSMGSSNNESSPAVNIFFKKPSKDKNVLILKKPGRQVRKIMMVIDNEYIKGINEIYRVSDVNKLALRNLSDVRDFIMVIRTKTREKTEEVVLVDTKGSPGCMLTYELLDHLSKNKDSIRPYDDNSSLIDLTEYVGIGAPSDNVISNKSVFKYALTAQSGLKRVKSILTPYELNTGGDYTHRIVDSIMSVYDKSKEFTSNALVCIETQMAAYLVTHELISTEDGTSTEFDVDYSMARAFDKSVAIVKFESLMANRSYATIMLYKRQSDLLFNIGTYLREHSTPRTGMDVALMPNEVVKDRMYKK